MHTIILLKNILEHHPKDYLKYIMKNLIKVDFQPKEKLECQILDDYLIITSSKKVWQGNKESTKVVNMPTNFYYDHTSCVTEENDSQQKRISFEIACSTSTPIPFQNQIFVEQDLLAYVMKIPFPTMSLHAAINKQENMSEMEVELHDITISKIETTLEIIYQYLPIN